MSAFDDFGVGSLQRAQIKRLTERLKKHEAMLQELRPGRGSSIGEAPHQHTPHDSPSAEFPVKDRRDSATTLRYGSAT
jgi:hypothetical protein